MDYNEFEKSIYDFYKKEIIKKFKEANVKKNSFTKAIDSIRNYLIEIKNSTIIYKNEKLIYDCIYDINHRLDSYQKDIALNAIISNEIKEKFDSVLNDMIDLDGKHLLIKFDDFIKLLITYDCLVRIEMRLSLNSELYKLFYENNNYLGFNLDTFNGHVVNSLLYKKKYSEFYPNQPVPAAIEEDTPFGKIYKIVVPNKSTKNILSKSLQNITIYTPEFDENEKCIILNLCLVDNNNISIPEKIKLIILLDGLKDYTIFEQSLNLNNIYAKINNGVYRKGSEKTMINSIQNIIKYIENFDLPSTKKRLIFLKNMLIKNNPS